MARLSENWLKDLESMVVLNCSLQFPRTTFFLDDSICCFNIKQPKIRKCLAQLPELRRCVSKPIGYMYGSTYIYIYIYIYTWVLRVI